MQTMAGKSLKESLQGLWFDRDRRLDAHVDAESLEFRTQGAAKKSNPQPSSRLAVGP